MTAQPYAIATRRIALTREGPVFRLAFDYDPTLVKRVKDLPFATFDPDSRSWTAMVATQTVDQLRRFYYEGLTDVGVDDLIDDLEPVLPAPSAVLRPGPRSRPFYVHFGTRGDPAYTRLRAVLGASWAKKAGALTYPAHAAAALAEFVDRGVLADPERLLSPAEATVVFDGRTGRFVVRGNPQAGAAFGRSFPDKDVVALWQDKGLDVAFLDEFTAEMYAGEIARTGPGFQPDGMLLDLLPYQRQAVALALARSGLGVYMAPGVGKTAVGIATGFELLHRRQISRVVVVVPAALRTQWKNEIIRFTPTAPEQIVVVDGRDKAHREKAYEAAADAGWLIVHYDVLKRDEELLKPLFSGALVIADEAQRVKTETASRTKALRELSKSAARRMAMSGTPVETSPAEWYSLLSGFAVPGCLGGSFEFNERYRYKGAFGYEGARNTPELRERSRPFYIRFTKEQVAEHLPPLRVQHVPLDPDPAYAAALRRAHADAAKEIKKVAVNRVLRANGQPVTDDLTLVDKELVDEAKAGADMTAVGMLRLMCSSPRLVLESDSEAGATLRAAGLIPDEDGPKIDELRTIAAELLATQLRRKQDMTERGITQATPAMVSGERVVIFTFSKRMAHLIADRFTTDGVPHVMFTGDTKNADRDAAVEAFTDPTSDVIAFIATDAAAEGLNLGRCCSTLIQADLPWTPAKAIQRMNRIHRIDGTAPAYHVINLTVAGTIEAGLLALLEQRAALADELFGEQGGKAKTTGRGGGFRGRAGAGGPRSLLEEAFEGYRVAAVRHREKRAADQSAAAAAAEAQTAAVPEADEQLALL